MLILTKITASKLHYLFSSVILLNYLIILQNIKIRRTILIFVRNRNQKV